MKIKILKYSLFFIVIISLIFIKQFYHNITENLDIIKKLTLNNSTQTASFYENGESSEFIYNKKFIVENDEIYIPIDILEKIPDFNIYFNTHLKVIKLKYLENELICAPNSRYFSINGSLKKNDTVTFIKNSKSFLPIKLVENILNLKAEPNNKNDTIILAKRKSENDKKIDLSNNNLSENTNDFKNSIRRSLMAKDNNFRYTFKNLDTYKSKINTFNALFDEINFEEIIDLGCIASYSNLELDENNLFIKSDLIYESIENFISINNVYKISSISDFNIVLSSNLNNKNVSIILALNNNELNNYDYSKSVFQSNDISLISKGYFANVELYEKKQFNNFTFLKLNFYYSNLNPNIKNILNIESSNELQDLFEKMLKNKVTNFIVKIYNYNQKGIEFDYEFTEYIKKYNHDNIKVFIDEQKNHSETEDYFIELDLNYSKTNLLPENNITSEKEFYNFMHKQVINQVNNISFKNCTLIDLNKSFNKFREQNYHYAIKDYSINFIQQDIEFNITYFIDNSKLTISRNKSKEIVNRFIKSTMSEKEKIRILHNYLVSNCNYDYNYNIDELPNITSSSYGALINGIAVCSGYASALNQLLIDANIKTMTISGTSRGRGHVWNKVLINDKEYYIDSTWNDTDFFISYEYLLVDENKMKKEHEWENNKFENKYFYYN